MEIFKPNRTPEETLQEWAKQLNYNFGQIGLGSIMGKFKTGTGTYTDNDASQTFTDDFCSTSSLVVVSITSTTLPQGTWSVDGAYGAFTITSSTDEAADITFDYYITKAV